MIYQNVEGSKSRESSATRPRRTIDGTNSTKKSKRRKYQEMQKSLFSLFVMRASPLTAPAAQAFSPWMMMAGIGRDERAEA
jgi:hypothetical protein